MNRRMFLTTAIAIIVAPQAAEQQAQLLRVWVDEHELRPDQFIFRNGTITLPIYLVGKDITLRYKL